jgi:hypothetical protein
LNDSCFFSKIADFEKERAEFMAQQKAAIVAAQFQTEDDEYDGILFKKPHLLMLI